MIESQFTSEIIAALQHSEGEGVRVVDPETNRVYVIVDEKTHRQAMEALRAQHDKNAIADGIAQMEAGLGKPAEQAFNDIHAKLDLPESR